MKNLIQGEQIQNLADMYVGFQHNFDCNPYIKTQTSKHLLINNINRNIDNPQVIFFYPHNIQHLPILITYFLNRFVLIMHNSDQNITNDYVDLLTNPKIIKVFAQNVCVDNDNIIPLPIGIANTMWPHGNISCFDNIETIKTKKIFFGFSINTNFNARSNCHNSLKNKLEFDSKSRPFKEYLIELAKHKFCICPVGNGMDTHRLWECFYLKIVPIVLDIPFYRILLKNYNLPLLIVDKWENISDLDGAEYETYDFSNIPYISDIKDLISSAVHGHSLAYK